MTMTARGDDKVTAIDKALMLLALIGEYSGRHPLRLREVVDLTGFSKPTAHRLLNVLRQHGLVFLDEETHRYELGAKTLVLASQYRGGVTLQNKSLPILRGLARGASATVHMGIRDGTSAVYVEKVESDQSIRLASAVGQRARLYSSSIGKVLLAHAGDEVFDMVVESGLEARTPNTITTPSDLRAALSQVVAEGYAIDDQENELGIRCVAAPVRDHRGEVVAAVSISGTLNQLPKAGLNRQVAQLQDACRRISEALGYWDSAAAQ